MGTDVLGRVVRESLRKWHLSSKYPNNKAGLMVSLVKGPLT